MTWYIVEAHLNGPGTAYTHYVCEVRHNAERLARVLAEKRPHLEPITVIEHEPTPEQLARRQRFADESDGPR